MSEPLRVLLVDDEEDFLRAVGRRLTRRGMDVREIASGEEALSMVKTTAVDVVVLDVKMPYMGGIEVLRRLQELRHPPEVILLTGHYTVQDGVEGMKSGAFDYLNKPVEIDHLAGKIRQAGEKRQRTTEKVREAEFRARMETKMAGAERLAALGTLAAGIAHEINNPLAIIGESAGWMKLLLRREDFGGADAKAKLENALSKIEKSVDRARRTTHQLLGFARKTDSVVKEVDPRELMEEVRALVRTESAHREIEIVLDMPDAEPVLVWTDPYLVRQVLLNLVSNALHAVGRSGTVTLALETDESGVRIRVADDGPGIPREIQGRIFEPFFTTKPPDQGTGLGLSVSRGLIEKLGGSIEVGSVIGQGAEFLVSLPRVCPSADRSDSGEVNWRDNARELERRNDDV